MLAIDRGYVINAGEGLLTRQARVADEKSAAWLDYNAQAARVDGNTARLKGLRLDKLRDEAAAAALVVPAPARRRSRKPTRE